MDYLLTLFDEQPRHYRVIEGILHGRRTVATLFWGQQYGLLDWFKAMPQLSRDDFDQLLQSYAIHSLLLVDVEHSTARLTAKGIQRVRKIRGQFYQPRLGKWAWAGENSALPVRLWLAVQALSQLGHGVRRYVPVTSSPAELACVRQWLRQPFQQLRKTSYEELQSWAHDLAQVDFRLATLFIYQFPGYHQAGWTQLTAAKNLQLESEELRLMIRDLWIGIGLHILQERGPLADLCRPLVKKSPLNQTTQQTLDYFRTGMAVKAIAARRHLKVSTIREHLLQAAILLPDSVNLRRLLGDQTLAQLRQRYHGTINDWQFQVPTGEDKATAFFEFRAYQILKSEEEHG